MFTIFPEDDDESIPIDRRCNDLANIAATMETLDNDKFKITY